MHTRDDGPAAGSRAVEGALSGGDLRRRRQALGLTQAALADLLEVAPTSVARWERGEQRVGRPDRVRAILDQLVPARAPVSNIRALRAAIRVLDKPGGPGPSELPAHLTPSQLPTQLSSFVGREREIAEIARELLSRRLLTLTGPGGVGKTRLALEVAARRQSEFADGVCFVSLAQIANPAMVPEAVLGALGLRLERNRPALETLLSQLRGRELLLVLDNCEHLLAGCSPLADALLRACPASWSPAASHSRWPANPCGLCLP